VELTCEASEVALGWFSLILVAARVAMMGVPPAARAQAEPLNVVDLQPATAQTNYMPLPGYLRWLTWRDQQVWLSYPEAARIVRAQVGTQARR
jgi:hypothetical protein